MKTIVTHDGKFHADDVCAVATISLALDEPLEVIRSRDPQKMESADYVVDVGRIYDEEKLRFDHHQIGGAGVRKNGIPYAAFGLVWKKFGEKLCGSAAVAEAIDVKMVQPLDAADSGVSIEVGRFEGVTSYGIDSAVDAFVSTWKESDRDLDLVFKELVQFAKALIAREILQARAKEEAKKFVEDAYANAPDKRLIVLDAPYPARGVLAKYPEPLYFVRAQNDGTWTINTVRDDPNSFENRKKLPSAWAGKRDRELEDTTGVHGSVFCHIGLFIAVAKTKEAALELARLAVNNKEN